MPKKGYRNVKIPEELFLRIQEHVEASEGRYLSISEVVRKALWEFLNAPTKKTPSQR
jgi:Arc/MetJ-type ribon-helix-helix transcriptional regulator